MGLSGDLIPELFALSTKLRWLSSKKRQVYFLPRMVCYKLDGAREGARESRGAKKDSLKEFFNYRAGENLFQENNTHSHTLLH